MVMVVVYDQLAGSRSGRCRGPAVADRRARDRGRMPATSSPPPAMERRIRRRVARTWLRFVVLEPEVDGPGEWLADRRGVDVAPVFVGQEGAEDPETVRSVAALVVGVECPVWLYVNTNGVSPPAATSTV